MPIILDGKQASQQIRDEIALEVSKSKGSGGKTPHLAAILVGDNPASESYIRNKVKACDETGFKSTLDRLESTVSELELLNRIDEINTDADIDGLIVQLPLPQHISVQSVTEKILPEKDVDGFHPVNVGRAAKNLPSYISATPFGILKLLERFNIPTVGKHCVVVGRSEIVGSPISILLARKAYPGNCTVTLCHSKTPDIARHTSQADILIAALGRPEFVTEEMVKPGAVVIDVGISRVKDPSRKSGYALKGDVAYDQVAPKCSHISPVPGGVGPMTIASLLWNTLLSCKKAMYS